MAGNEENIYIVDRSEEQILSINARKRKVKETLSSLGINVKENSDPPVIAVLGSGGGLRATVGFLGTISKLVELNLLGTATYMAGISGSTWCMSSLYSKKKNWTDFSGMKDLENQLCEQMKSETKRKCQWEKIKEIFLGDSYSMTDLWAYTVVYNALNTINEEKLSSHKEMCESGEVPYPIYAAVRKYQIYHNKPEAWFEFTPHISGFPALKSYVKTEYLGSKFEGGHLLEKKPEYDLMYLQGLWGSAPGADLILKVLHDVFKKIMGKLTRDESAVTLSPEMKQDESAVTLSPEMKQEIINQLQLHIFDGDSLTAIWNILCCFAQWKWGTTNNFLYHYKDKILEGRNIDDEEYIYLIDAGLEINTPYPLVLLPQRKVDLILSFDFSEGDPFETVKTTVEYCKKNKIPFPKDCKKQYENTPTKSCYVFKGDGNETPDVMHFPLFNTQTCGNAEKIKELIEKYDTCVPTYDDSMIEELLNIAKENVENSRDQILKQIKRCVRRCKCFKKHH